MRNICHSPRLYRRLHEAGTPTQGFQDVERDARVFHHSSNRHRDISVFSTGGQNRRGHDKLRWGVGQDIFRSGVPASGHTLQNRSSPRAGTSIPGPLKLVLDSQMQTQDFQSPLLEAQTSQPQGGPVAFLGFEEEWIHSTSRGSRDSETG